LRRQNQQVLTDQQNNISNNNENESQDKYIEQSVQTDAEINLPEPIVHEQSNETYNQTSDIQPTTIVNYSVPQPTSSLTIDNHKILIKKEPTNDDQFIYFPYTTTSIPVSSIIDSEQQPCLTLKDFLEKEDLKKTDFTLECQRIGFRLAKIQDCIRTFT